MSGRRVRWLVLAALALLAALRWVCLHVIRVPAAVRVADR
jgi:hypothetical protein